MKKKLCIVIHQYNTENADISEIYCKMYAERLSRIYDVEVITTCASDNNVWKNHFPVGLSQINGVNIRRFPVDIKKNKQVFANITENIYNKTNYSEELAKTWIDAQGPLSRGLIKYIEDNFDNFDLFIFMNYKYYHTVMGLPSVKEKALLVPFAQKEPQIYIKLYEKIFSSCKGIVYFSEEEMTFVQNYFKIKDIPSIISGAGIDLPEKSSYANADKKFRLFSPFILYLGKIDKGNGSDTLIKYFIDYKKKYNNDLTLVLAGEEIKKPPRDKNIISLGKITEEEKYALLSECIALVTPSQFESYSINALEALAMKKPVLINAACEALKGLCIKSNAGLFFSEKIDFCECLDLLYNQPHLREAMRTKGLEYIENNFQWNKIIDKLTAFINSLCD